MTNVLQQSSHSDVRHATAAELMTPNPVSLHASATIQEVVAFLTETGFSAAPVIDDAGRPIGVVSRTDVVVYDRARDLASADIREAGVQPSQALQADGDLGVSSRGGQADPARAADLITLKVFAVEPEATAVEVGREMVRLNVHRLYVIDGAGVLVGVISALDLIRHLCEV